MEHNFHMFVNLLEEYQVSKYWGFGNFTELPAIRMKTRTGVNASFIPVFNVIRDPFQ